MHIDYPALRFPANTFKLLQLKELFDGNTLFFYHVMDFHSNPFFSLIYYMDNDVVPFILHHPEDNLHDMPLSCIICSTNLPQNYINFGPTPLSHYVSLKMLHDNKKSAVD